MHAITPESRSSSHYFYRSVKNYGDSALSAGIRERREGDLRAGQAACSKRSSGASATWICSRCEPVSFGGDMLQQRARRINRALLDLETGKA